MANKRVKKIRFLERIYMTKPIQDSFLDHTTHEFDVRGCHEISIQKKKEE